MGQLSFFDLNDRLAQISKIGDPLEVLNEIVDWSKFDGMLEEKGLFARGGSIVDATIVNVPVQRNKADENETIKKGKEPEE
ncbi:MAG: hypothetical protein PUK29_05995, partial [Fibrobacter sp.]|nr:hypothetical protein [Fibrobacter sp.]MDD7497794.1 hypothetical protein [Fibrobacter sp.]MDY5724399.1 hypothetical protein [Fibrobacter sp.]